jgi:hypothetical protein
MLAVVNLIKYAVLLLVVPYLNFYYWREYGAHLTETESLERCASIQDIDADRLLNLRKMQQQFHVVAEKVAPAKKVVKRKVKSTKPCIPLKPEARAIARAVTPAAVSVSQGGQCHGKVISGDDYGRFSKVDSKTFGEYKGRHLIQLKSPALTAIILDANGIISGSSSDSSGSSGTDKKAIAAANKQMNNALPQSLQRVQGQCRSVVNPMASARKDCLAIVHADIGNAHNRIRINIKDEKTGMH